MKTYRDGERERESEGDLPRVFDQTVHWVLPSGTRTHNTTH